MNKIINRLTPYHQMAELPDNVKEYKRTPLFNEETAPKGFLNEHSTKTGTWGVLTVATGELIYHITDPTEYRKYRLNSEHRGIIVPEQLHHLEITQEVSFYVTFYR